MAASNKNFYLEQGSNWERLIVCKDNTGTVVPIVGASAILTARISPADVPLLLLTSAAGIVVNGAAGSMDITISAALSSAISVANLPPKISAPCEVDAAGNLQNKTGHPIPFQLEITQSGIPKRLVDGLFIFSPEC